MRASEFITETWPVAMAKWFDILRKSQKYKHLPDEKIQNMAARAAQRELTPKTKKPVSMKDRFNQHRKEMSDAEFRDYYGFGKWDNISEGLSAIDRQFLDMVGADVEEQQDIGEYSLYVIHTPSFEFGDISFPEAHQLAINKRNIAFTDPALQHEKFVKKGERYPLGSIGQLKDTVSSWIRKYGPLLVVSDSESKQKTYEKLLNRLGFNMERTTYQMQPGVYVSENIETVDVDEVHANALKEHLLANPALFENQKDYQQMRKFLDSQKTTPPTVGNQYIYASTQVVPAAHYVNTAHFDNPHELVDIDDTHVYFNVNGDVKRYPETGSVTGDLLSQIYFFDNKKQLEQFIVLSKLKFSDYTQTYKILDDSLDENFADGKVKGKSRPGRVKKAGASCKGSVSHLRKMAKKYSGERGKMYRWCLNMKAGKQKD